MTETHLLLAMALIVGVAVPVTLRITR